MHSPGDFGVSESWAVVDDCPDKRRKCAVAGCPCDATAIGDPTKCCRRCETGAGPCPSRAHIAALLKHGHQWASDDTPACHKCTNGFGTFNRKHHCRSCGEIFCGTCCHEKLSMSDNAEAKDEERVCVDCADSLKVNRSRNAVRRQ